MRENDAIRGIVAAVMILVLVAAISQTFAGDSVSQVQIPDTERRVLASRFVDEEFKIHVYLPRNYPEEGRRYPVIYLLDSEYSFGCVSYVVRRLIKGREIPPAIVVGVSYEVPYEDFYRRRQRDYTPSAAHLEEFPAAGHGPAFFQFIEKELIPFVDATYATEPDDRTLVGLSFSGLFSTWVLFNHPEIINRYVIISPSLWWDNGVSFRYEEAYAKNHQSLRARVYLIAGEHDGRNIVKDVPRLIGRLESRSYQGFVLGGGLLEDETHRTIFPNAVTKGLRFVFKDLKP
ncbi:MAG: alpha/beta hydrolase-fold protein [Thermoanaerobaculales bacterium]|nr:alpha/beta hydrolase-fold protein [Thermoanaerobaculales bacterium]